MFSLRVFSALIRVSFVPLLIGTVLLGGPGAVGAHPPQEAPIDTSAASAGVTTAPADSALEARLQRIFAQIDDFQGITVDVNSGVVRMTGSVLQAQDAADAEALARQLPGVLYVVNEVNAETDVETRVAPALDRIREYARRTVAYLPLAGIALLVVLLFWGISRGLGHWQEPPAGLHVSPLVWQLVRRVIQGVIAFIGVLLAFDLLGVTAMVGAVLGTAGIAGLAIGFAFQDIIENYLAGVLLSIQRPFHVNDVVQVGDQEGRVVRLTARELVLLTFEGNHVRLPNATVFKGVMVNYTRNPRRLFYFDVGIGVLEDLTEVTRFGVDTLDAMKGVLEDPSPFARVRELGDSSVTMRFHGWVNQQEADFFKVKSEAIRLVKAALDEAGVDMPEPTYRLQVWRNETPVSAGTRVSPEATAAEQAATIDVVPDRKLEEQVEEELAQSEEPNLLSDDESREGKGGVGETENRRDGESENG